MPIYFSLLLVVSFSSFQHQHAPHIKIPLQFVPVLVRVDASSLIRPVLSYIRVSNPLLLNFVFGVVINLNFLFISPFLVGRLCYILPVRAAVVYPISKSGSFCSIHLLTSCLSNCTRFSSPFLFAVVFCYLNSLLLCYFGTSPNILLQ